MLSLNEPLALSAPLARRWALSHCHPGQEGCGWYHGAWQTFRLLGLFTTISSDDDFFSRVLPPLCRTGERSILVSGAADYALLARIVAAAAGRGSTFPRVTVVDRCATPLLLNQWYARQAGVPLVVEQADILAYAPPAPFDLICTHSFLGFFPRKERTLLVDAWFRMLKPGGVVVTAQRVRPRETGEIRGYSPEECHQLGRRARDLAAAQFGAGGLDPAVVEQMAHAYARRYTSHVIGSVAELERLFVEAGFRIREFQPPRHGIIADHPGAPEDTASQRWRIVVQKPGDADESGDMS